MNIDFLNTLNKIQTESIESDCKRVCIVAGPGCGKTRTILGKIIHLLIVKKQPANSIIVLTFSKKAIKEIKDRIKSTLSIEDQKDVSKLKTNNFHSFCFEILKNWGFLIGIPEIIIYDSHEQLEVIEQIFKEDSIESKNFYKDGDNAKYEIISKINNVKNGKIALENLSSLDQKIFNKYNEYLINSKVLDYNDLILKTIELLREKSYLTKQLQKTIKYFLIDEFQDINSIQWKAINYLINENSYVFIVGDPNQSIYGFQGSNSNLFLSFINSENWKSFYLNINYRSTKNLVELSNSYIKNNDKFIKNILISNKGEGFTEIEWLTGLNSSKIIVNKIKELVIGRKYNYGDIAVLFRINFSSAKIERELIFNRIPYDMLGSYKILKREEIQLLIFLLRSIAYKDNISILKTIILQNTIGKLSIEKIKKLSINSNRHIYDILKSDKELESLKLGNEKIKVIKNFLKILDNESEKINNINYTLFDFMIDISNSLGLLRHISKNEQKVAISKKRNLLNFINLSIDWEKKFLYNSINLRRRIIDFLQWVVIHLVDEKDNKDSIRNSITLSSIHQSKGLEFPVVFFLDLNERIIPYWDTDDIEEEKRLFYVGITRTKDKLFLLSSKKHSKFIEKLDKTKIKKIDEAN